MDDGRVVFQGCKPVLQVIDLGLGGCCPGMLSEMTGSRELDGVGRLTFSRRESEEKGGR